MEFWTPDGEFADFREVDGSDLSNVVSSMKKVINV
jgi:hypothetical protein